MNNALKRLITVFYNLNLNKFIKRELILLLSERNIDMGRNRTSNNKKKPVNDKDTKIKKIERMLELPSILVENMPHIEMTGNREIIIEGSRGILEYDENLVKINGGKFAITIFGRELELRNLTDDSVIVQGNVDNIGFGV